MNIEIETFLMIVTALGGFESIKFGVQKWSNRKTDARKENAQAESMEIQNTTNYIRSMEERMSQRDAKIDALYLELRAEQMGRLEDKEKRLEDLKRFYAMELRCKIAEYNRCDLPDNECSRRKPPRRKHDLKQIEEHDKGTTENQPE